MAPEKIGAQRLHLYLSGHVQGVGMRSFVWRKAEGLGLNGFVRNLPDGRVEVVAEGDPALLEQLMQDLEKSPVGRIDRITVADRGPASNRYRSFTIEY